MKMALSAALRSYKKLNVSFSMSFYWRELLFIIIVALFGLLRYWDFFKASYPCLQLLRDDIVNQFYPAYFFAKKALSSGSFPFWDPHTSLGHPIAANLGFGIFYPPLLGLLSLPFLKELTPRCLELFTIWHFVLAGIAVYISSRILRINSWGALIGSIAYTSFPVNNYMISWTPIVFGIPWIPVIIATFLRILNAERGDFNRSIFLLYIFSSIMLYTTLHPSLIAYTSITVFLLGVLNITRDILQRKEYLLQMGKRYLNVFIALIMSILLLSFLIIPVLRYLPFMARDVIPIDPAVGSLGFIEFRHILFPGITTLLGPLCYFGVIFLGIVFFYCIFVNRKIKNPLLWIVPLIVIFWLLYSLEKSPFFFFIKKKIPLMDTMRYASRSLVLNAVFFSFMIGDFFSLLTHRWKEKIQFLRLNKGLDLLLPVAIISIFCYTYKDFWMFIGGKTAFLKDFGISLFLLAIAFFFILVILHYPFRYNWRNTTLAMSIFLLIIGWVEVVHFAPIFFLRQEKTKFAPYDRFVKSSVDSFPEVYKDGSLYRYHNFGFKSIVPYWTNTYSASGITWPYMITLHPTIPAAYYYLWSREWPGNKDTFYTKPTLLLDSPVYDLMGVKYFLFPEKRIWIYLSRHRDYYKLCKDEWFSGNFNKKRRISYFRIYLKSEFIDEVSGSGILYLDSITKYRAIKEPHQYQALQRRFLDSTVKYRAIKEPHLNQALQQRFLDSTVKHRAIKEPHLNQALQQRFLDSTVKYRAIKEPHLNQALQQRFLDSTTNYRAIKEPHQYQALQRRFLDNGFTYRFGLSGQTGWQRIKFPLTESENFKILIKRNGMSADRRGPRDILLGCTIGEVEFYDDKGTRILIDKDSIAASSTASFSNPLNLIDNDTRTIWKPGIEEEVAKFLESETVKRLREGLYLNTDVLPRAFMVYDCEVVKTKDELWEKLHSPDFEPERAVLLDKDPGIASEDKGPYSNEVRIEKYRPNSVEIYVDTPRPGFLVLSDMYAPGWEVSVDGRKKETFLAYGVFRAVWVDKGRHRIHFQYLPPFFGTGLILSIGSFIFLLYFLWQPRKTFFVS